MLEDKNAFDYPNNYIKKHINEKIKRPLNLRFCFESEGILINLLYNLYEKNTIMPFFISFINFYFGGN
jgi:hypothetical protein